MKIVLRDRSTKNIDKINMRFLELVLGQFDKLTDSEKESLEQEYFNKTPYHNESEEAYKNLSVRDKVISHFRVYGFMTNDIMRKQYEFWKSLDVLGRKTYYNFLDLDKEENAVLNFTQFKKIFQSKNLSTIQDIGTLQIDLYFNRIPQIILDSLRQLLYDFHVDDVFIEMHGSERLIEGLSVSKIFEVMQSICYERREKIELKREYKQESVYDRKLNIITPRPILKINLSNGMEIKLDVLTNKIIY